MSPLTVVVCNQSPRCLYGVPGSSAFKLLDPQCNVASIKETTEDLLMRVDKKALGQM